VLVNAAPVQQDVRLALVRTPAVGTLNVVRTSATEDGQELGPVSASGGTVTLTVPPTAIVTLTTLR
jgi:hypothetical protein